MQEETKLAKNLETIQELPKLEKQRLEEFNLVIPKLSWVVLPKLLQGCYESLGITQGMIGHVTQTIKEEVSGLLVSYLLVLFISYLY